WSPRSRRCRHPAGLERDATSGHSALPARASAATAGSPASCRPKAALRQGWRGATIVARRWSLCSKWPLLGDLDWRRTLRRFFGAEYPYQPAKCADDEVNRAEQQRNVDAFGGHQTGISEGEPHGGLA